MGFSDEVSNSFLGNFGTGTPGRLMSDMMSTPDWAAFTTLTPSGSLCKDNKPRTAQFKEHNPFELSFSTGAGHNTLQAEEDEPTPSLDHDEEMLFKSSLKRSSSPSDATQDQAKRPRMAIVQSSQVSSDSPASSAVRTPSATDFPLPVIHEHATEALALMEAPSTMDFSSTVPPYTGYKSEHVLPTSSNDLSHLRANFNSYVPPHVQPLPLPLPALSSLPRTSLQPGLPPLLVGMPVAIEAPIISAPPPVRRMSNASDSTVLAEAPKVKVRGKPGPKKGSTRKPKPKVASADDLGVDGVEGEGDDEEKRKQFLERNRLAACKSRQKKKEWIGGLEQQTNELAAQNSELQALVATLREEVVQLRISLKQHQGCSCSSGSAAASNVQSARSVNTNTGRPLPSNDQADPSPRSLAMTSLPAFEMPNASGVPLPTGESVIEVPLRHSSAPPITPSYMDQHRLLPNDYFSQLPNAGSHPLTTPDLVAQLGLHV